MFGFIRVLADTVADPAAGVSVAGGGAAATGAADAAGTAAGAAGAAGGVLGLVTTLLPMVLIIALLYFIMIRPQRKKEKELKAQIDAMRVGDKIITIGGICGKVAKIKDEYVYIETGNIGTQNEKSLIKFERSAIKTVETIHDDQ